MQPGKASLVIPVLLTLLPALAHAAQADRITGTIDPSQMVILRDHVSAMARPQDDQGPVEASRQMHVTMLFTRTEEQQKAMQKLLEDLQDPKSANYHKWLTSDEYGARFGLSQGDIDKISAWLTAEGFKITYLAHGHDFLSFRGNALQVQSVFKTEIHNYSVQGKMHFANTTPPFIPVALSGIVGGFRGLHDFGPHSMLRKHADYTLSGQSGHFLAPGDLATIYDINPLYQASPAIDGSGQNVVIAGQSDVYLADLNDYRTAFGFSSISGCTMDSTNTIIKAGNCSSGNFQMVVPQGSPDPGISAGDLSESDLDIEIMSSVARKAKIIFVTSGAATGVDDSANWAIDQNPPLAHVISYSYGLCEAFVTAPSIATAETTYSKAASEGISFFAATGDAGSATCDGDNNSFPAILGLSVSYPASSPNVIAVGGTEFNEGGGTFWNPTNGTDGGSAMSYIPEIAWNDSVLAGALDGTGGGPSNCASGSGMTTVGGFQFEICNAPPNGGFPKPTWQSGITPSDSVRDLPDISFSASNANDPYIVCTPQSEIGNTGSTSTCAPGGTTGINNAITAGSAFGGTSASTPLAAGMAVLLNQFLGASGLGNMNPQLYGIYANSTAPFHDIVAGSDPTGTSDNIVPCTAGTPSFEPAALQCPSVGKMGFSAGAGYDYVTGLGSIDINKFFDSWPQFTLAANAVNPASVSAGNSTTTTVSVAPKGPFSGKITFSASNCSAGTFDSSTTFHQCRRPDQPRALASWRFAVCFCLPRPQSTSKTGSGTTPSIWARSMSRASCSSVSLLG